MSGALAICLQVGLLLAIFGWLVAAWPVPDTHMTPLTSQQFAPPGAALEPLNARRVSACLRALIFSGERERTRAVVADVKIRNEIADRKNAK